MKTLTFPLWGNVRRTQGITLLAVLISTILFAQNGINYKALIKDNNGNTVSNQNIDIVFTIEIEDGSVYSETQQITTDNNGIAIAVIGTGNVISGDFNTIDWKPGNAALNIQINLGNGLVDFGNSEFNMVPYAIQTLNIEGLEAIDEGNGIGWRLAGNNPDYYGNIGLNAVDLSYNPTDSTVRGATGAYAIAMGKNTEAMGEYAVAMGRSTEAQGNFSFAFGDESEAQGNNSIAMGVDAYASGDNAIAMGNDAYATNNYAVALGRDAIASGESSFATGIDTEASGTYATALGRNTTASASYSTAMGNLSTASGPTATAIGKVTMASGDTSTAMGNHTVASGNISTALGFETDATGDVSLATGSHTLASGNYSTALGYHTRSKAFSSIAIGRFNVGFGNSETWEESNALFEIGNGTSDETRSNALTVNKNGSHYIRSRAIGLSITAETIGLSVFNSGDSGIVVGQSEKHGAVLEGKNSGLLTRSSISGNPDIILAGNSSANNEDDGIIISDPNYLGSDIFLKSNDDIVLELDDNDNEAGVFRIRNGGDTDVFTVNESGNVRVNGNVVHNSDKRLKTTIENLNYGLKEILQLQPKQYYWKNQEQNKKSLGLIAQDVQTIINEIVTTQDDEMKTLGVSYTQLIPVLIKAIQEQNKIIKNQGKALKTSHKNYEALLSRIAQLESKSSN
jgi:hypothetical protein